jgi:hypothetical protein
MPATSTTILGCKSIAPLRSALALLGRPLSRGLIMKTQSLPGPPSRLSHWADRDMLPFVGSAVLKSGEPAQREVRRRHRPGTAASFAQRIESRDRRRPADIAARE